MAVSTNGNATGTGSGLSLTAAQVAAGATGVIGSDTSGNAYKQDGTAFSGGGSTTYAGLTDAATVNLPTVNTPLATALAAKATTASVAALPSTLVQCGIAIGIAPAACVVAANGATLVMPTGIPFLETYNTPGLWLYFTAGAIDTAQIAGFYWVVMSSTTAGQIYQNTYTPGTNSFSVPGTLTPYTANSGNAATTGTTTQITTLQNALAAGVLGANGALRYRGSLRSNNSAGSKNLFFAIGATFTSYIANTTTTLSANVLTCFNVGAANSQNYSLDTNAGSSGVAGNFSINTAAASTAGFALKLATATDWCVQRYSSIELIPAP